MREPSDDLILSTEVSDQQVYLEEYKLLVSIIRHIFGEFWQTNALFMSFFTAITLALLLNLDKLPEAHWLLMASSIAGILVLAAVWLISNLKHQYYIDLHINHDRRLDQRLVCSIYATRLETKPHGLARI